MHTSTLTHAVSMAFAAAMLVLTNKLTGAKLPAPTEEQRAQTDLAKARTAWDGKMAAFQTCKAQDEAAALYRAGGKAAYTQSGVPCADSGPFIVPVPAASAPASAAKG